MSDREARGDAAKREYHFQEAGKAAGHVGAKKRGERNYSWSSEWERGLNDERDHSRYREEAREGHQRPVKIARRDIEHVAGSDSHTEAATLHAIDNTAVPHQVDRYAGAERDYDASFTRGSYRRAPLYDRVKNVDGAETPEFQARYEARRSAVRERLKRLHENRKIAAEE